MEQEKIDDAHLQGEVAPGHQWKDPIERSLVQEILLLNPSSATISNSQMIAHFLLSGVIMRRQT